MKQISMDYILDIRINNALTEGHGSSGNVLGEKNTDGC